jgi:uncharacterized damage-inducible protein DinB
MNLLDRFLGHNAATIQHLVELSRSLTDAQLDQQFDIGLRTPRATIDHIVDCMEWWTDLMNGQAQRTFEQLGTDPMTLEGMQKRLEIVAVQFADVARQKQATGQLDETWSTRLDQPKAFSYGTTIVHVITHSAHHRAQLMYMLRSLGVQNVPDANALNW